MRPHEIRAVRLHQQAVKRALDLFESCPDYPSVQVQIQPAMRSVDQNTRDPNKTDKQRRALLLKHFKIRAKAFVQLVSDMPSQKAFITLLEDWVDSAWLRYAGYPIYDYINSGNEQVQAFLDVYEDWKSEGFKRLAIIQRGMEDKKPAGRSKKYKMIDQELQRMTNSPPTSPTDTSKAAAPRKIQLQQTSPTTNVTAPQSGSPLDAEESLLPT